MKQKTFTHVEHKTCTSCLVSLPLESFFKNPASKTGLHTKCKPCMRAVRIRDPKTYKDRSKKQYSQKRDQKRAYAREYARNNPEKVAMHRRRAALKKYGLTVKEYDIILSLQGGACAICGKTCTKQLSVDHDHITGRVRGLLCGRCNRGIGLLGDTFCGVEAAYQYLLRNEERHIVA